MLLPPFKLEEYFALWEFKAEHLLCASDPESMNFQELVAWGDPETSKLWEGLRGGYTETRGHPLLLQEIGLLYSQRQAVATFAGAEEAIFCVLSAILKRGDHAIVVTPCYQSLLEVGISRGAQLTEFPLHLEDGRWRLPLKNLREQVRPNTRCIIVNFPHNPTGATLSRDEQKALIKIVEDHDLFLVADEVYRFTERDAKDALPAFADSYEKALSIGGMAKSFGLAGLRIGWVASQCTEIVEKALQIKLYLSISNAAPSEILSCIALRNKESIFSRLRSIQKSNLQIIERSFLEDPDIFRLATAATCIGFCELPGVQNIDAFADDLVRSTGVLILPGSVFGAFSKFFRIGYGRQDFPIAFEKFVGFLKNYGGNRG